jgi:hypothetical protein
MFNLWNIKRVIIREFLRSLLHRGHSASEDLKAGGCNTLSALEAFIGLICFWQGGQTVAERGTVACWRLSYAATVPGMEQSAGKSVRSE